MQLSTICANCKACGEVSGHAEGDERLIFGDLAARTLVILRHQVGFEKKLDQLMDGTPYAVTFDVRCTLGEDPVAQQQRCATYTRQLLLAFDAFVIEKGCAIEWFQGVKKDGTLQMSPFGPVVFFEDISKQGGRLKAVVSGMQEVRSGRVTRKGMLKLIGTSTSTTT